VQIAEIMERRGGLATRADLIAACSRREVDRGLREGVLVAAGRGRYTVPAVEAARSAAFARNAVLSLTSAALVHGWEVKEIPPLPHVLVPRKRNVPRHLRHGVVLHRGDLCPDDISEGIATSRELTLLQCLRRLPPDEALVITDSTLRQGEQATLRSIAATVRGAGSAQVRWAVAAARGEAANAFESVTRYLAQQVAGLAVEPQVIVRSPHVWARPDLVDVERRLVIECESYEWHSSRGSLRKDVRRYSLLVADGWLVLRFTWEDVMFRPEWVIGVISRTVALGAAQAQPSMRATATA
jgi:very-short-patch-repair endonuclease